MGSVTMEDSVHRSPSLVARRHRREGLAAA